MWAAHALAKWPHKDEFLNLFTFLSLLFHPRKLGREDLLIKQTEFIRQSIISVLYFLSVI